MGEQQSLDVQQFLDQQPFSKFQWQTLGLCFAVVLLDGFDTGAVGFIAPSLIKEWGVSRPALAPVLSAALMGLAAGALLAGPLSDRVGRKRVLVSAVILFGAASLVSAFAGNLTQLSVLRFITGVGLGAAMPNAVTLISEYCPSQRRATLTNAMFCGFPLGAALGGFLAAWIIPHWGWRSVLILGGIAPLVLALLSIVLLPESVRYMIAKGHPAEGIRAILKRISAGVAEVRSYALSEVATSGAAHSGIGVVFSSRYLVGSLMLWLAYFSGLVIFYSLINWMPTLLRDSGLDPQHATLVSALFPLGGVGAVFAGWLMDHFNANRVVAAGYALTAASLYAIGQAVGNLGLLIVVVFVSGTFMNTSQSSLPSLAAAFYPTQGRATGVAWMMGIGRFGGILGSFLVAELTRRQLGFDQIFAIMAIPGVLAALAILVKQAASPDARHAMPARSLESPGH